MPLDYDKIYEGLKRHIPTACETHVVAGDRVTQEYDDFGNHRIVIPERAQISPWTPYSYIARVGDFAGTTEYYSGVLPVVFKIVKE